MTRIAGLVLLLSAAPLGLAQSYALTVDVDGRSVPFEIEAPGTLEEGGFVVPTGAERVAITFAGGALDLNLADLGRFDTAHVVGVAFRREAERSYRVDATVRHRDEGWDHYADVWRVEAASADAVVENGERVLLHPHDTEQPFTRSQGGVRAAGTVVVVAADTVHGGGGSTITVDLDRIEAESISVSYVVTPR